MRHRDPLTPDEARELDALERALAGDPVDPDLRAFEELVCDLRATAPQMTPAFAARLERDVADGFPGAAPQPLARLRRPRRWVLLPAAGVLASALIALVIVLGQDSSQPEAQLASGPPKVTRESGASTAAEPAAPATALDSGAPSAAATPAPKAADRLLGPPPAASAGGSAGSGAVAQSSAPRKTQRTAELVLETPAGKVEETSDGVIRAVDRFGGIVASSSIGTDAQTGGEATFDLRIPTERLDAALAALSKLGHVASRTQDLQDITGSFTSAQDRLSDARAERRGLLKALGRATTSAQIDSLKARLRDVRATISRLNGDLASLRRRADLSRVSLTIRGTDRKGAGATDGDGTWSPGDAARDALRVLEVMAGVALIALAILVPLGLLGVAIALAARTARRRGRERALDPA